MLRSRYSRNGNVSVLREAVCPDASASSTMLWFINVSKMLGSNVSDARCLGDLSATSGTASLSRRHVTQYQRFYRFTPSQCKACSERLQKPLPPSCLSRVYVDNLDNVSVPCARLVSERADALVVDAEGWDAAALTRLTVMKPSRRDTCGRAIPRVVRG